MKKEETKSDVSKDKTSKKKVAIIGGIVAGVATLIGAIAIIKKKNNKNKAK